MILKHGRFVVVAQATNVINNIFSLLTRTVEELESSHLNTSLRWRRARAAWEVVHVARSDGVFEFRLGFRRGPPIEHRQ